MSLDHKITGCYPPGEYAVLSGLEPLNHAPVLTHFFETGFKVVSQESREPIPQLVHPPISLVTPLVSKEGAAVLEDISCKPCLAMRAFFKPA